MRSRRISAPLRPSSARASALAELTHVITVSAAANNAAAAINRTNAINPIISIWLMINTIQIVIVFLFFS